MLHTAPTAVSRQICPRLLMLLHPQQDPVLLAASLQASATVLQGATAQHASLFVQKIEPLLLVRTCTEQQHVDPFALSLSECKGMWLLQMWRWRYSPTVAGFHMLQLLSATCSTSMLRLLAQAASSPDGCPVCLCFSATSHRRACCVSELG
jgi:hypothetical protein